MAPDVFLAIGLGLNLAVFLLLARSLRNRRVKRARRARSNRMAGKRNRQE
jgi:hypothetical protein